MAALVVNKSNCCASYLYFHRNVKIMRLDCRFTLSCVVCQFFDRKRVLAKLRLPGRKLKRPNNRSEPHGTTCHSPNHIDNRLCSKPNHAKTFLSCSVRHPSTFPASFYTQSASPQRSSSTSGYNGSLPGSVSPSSNPYAPGFPNQAVSQLYAAQQAAQSGFHPTTSPLATTNNGTTTAAATEWPYSSQYQQAFSHQQYQSTNTQATATTPTSTLQSHHAYNQLAYPFTHQQEQHHRTPAFATGETYSICSKF